MYSILSKYYDDLFKEDQKIKSFIKEFIKPEFFAIDLGSGTGRLTKVLYDFKMKVYGVDLDPFMIEVSSNKYPDIKFLELDLLEGLDLNDNFDLITCFGNTIPHLKKMHLIKFIDKAYLKLKSNGSLLIQLLNYNRILKHKITELPFLKSNEVSLKREYIHKLNLTQFKTTLVKDNECFESNIDLYPYTKDELQKIFNKFNFSLKFYGNLDFKEFDENDYYLYLVAIKNA